MSDKTRSVYAEIFDRHGEGAVRAMMVGNSIRSDVRPALEAGGWGVHVPRALTWEVENDTAPEGAPRFRALADLGQLATLVAEIG